MTAAELDRPATDEPAALDGPTVSEAEDDSAKPDASATPPGRGRAARGLPQLNKAVGVLLGSTTVLTAIMFYFGWSWAYWFYMYFGVDSSLLGLTTRDYVQISVDGLFVPLAVIACVALAVLWGWSGLSAWAARHGRSRAVAIGLPVAGAVLLFNGLSAIFHQTPLNRPLAVAPICLAAGAATLVVGVRRHRNAIGVKASDGVAVAEWAVIFVLAGLGAFWAVNDYSAAVGESRAEQFVREMPTLPDATLFSERSMGLAHAGIREIRCTDPKAAYGYRYDGLKLILQSGDQYLLLPSRWNSRRGVAVLLPRTDSIRLEFTAPGAPRSGTTTC
jgi:hypothetical protein